MNEDFDNSIFMSGSGLITSILYSNSNLHIIKTGGNLRRDQHAQLGIPYYQLCENPNIKEDTRKIILDCLNSDKTSFPGTITISSEILKDDEILEAIKNKETHINIRIADEGYTLSQEDFDRLSFASSIIVDYCDSKLKNNEKIILQGGLFKYVPSYNQPVLERRSSFEELNFKNVFHINHKLSSDEFDIVVQALNQDDYASIELDYFDPNYYKEFLSELDKRKLKSNINIRLIGYLLEDQIDDYEQLMNYPFEIDIVYSTCHDMVDFYQQEPYVENRLYYSQIEGGGFTSLQNYLNVLEMIHSFEQDVNNYQFTPLEAAIYAKMQIDSDYIYDPDADDVDEWDNINLSQMINHEVDGKKRAVCLGFSTLYSALLRRNNIPMFRYSTRGHSRNIGRIIDEKYGVDTVGVTDITWDLESSTGQASYSLFMNAPRDWTKLINKKGNYEPLTIATTFSIPMEYYEDICNRSIDTYEWFYHPQSFGKPMGYTARMLELMNPNYIESNVTDAYNDIYTLCENGCLEGVPRNTILEAVGNVLRKIGENEASINDYCNLVEESLEYRDDLFNNSPNVSDWDGTTDYPIDLLTTDNISEYRESLNNNPSHTRFIKQYPYENNSAYEVVTNEENTNYIANLLNYVTEHNITIYDYYLDVADKYINHKEDELQEFEHSNPFIKGQEIELLTTSDDQMISLYFATSLSRVIELNVQNIDNYRDLFVDNVEVYNDSIAHSR